MLRLAVALCLLCPALAATEPALRLVEGRPLDDEFLLRFNLSWDGAESAKLVFHWSDAENNCAVEFDAKTTRLTKTEAGKLSEIAKAGAEQTKEAAFILKRMGERVTLYKDNTPLLEGTLAQPRRGKMGVAAGPGAKFTGLKYQPLGPIRYRDGFMRSAGDNDPWTVQRGKFAVSSAIYPDLSVSPFNYVGHSADGDAFSTHGEWFWSDYEVRAAMRAAACTAGETVSSYEQCRGLCNCYLPHGQLDVLNGGTNAIVSPALCAGFSPVELGVAFYVESPTTYRMLRVTGGSSQRCELVEIKDGKETVAAQRPVQIPPGQWFSLRVMVRGNTARCYIDDCLAFTQRLTGLVGGAVGVWTRGADGTIWDAQFDDVAVTSLEMSEEELSAKTDSPALMRWLATPDPGTIWVPNYFTYQPTMREWADPRMTFVPRGAYSWYAATLFGDAQARWESPDAPFKAGVWSAVFAKVAGNIDNGYRVTLNGTTQRVEAFRSGKSLGVRDVKLSDAGARSLQAEWNGGKVRFLIDDREVANFDDPQPLLEQAHVGFSIDEQPAQPGGLSVLSSHLRDETFARAPAEWRSAAGSWEIVSRWACSPRYTWFGGKGAGSGQSALWSKRAFGGDQVLDAYVAPGMSERYTPFYDRPLNVALSFCSDGKDLASGYTFQFGFQDSPARLFKKGKLVADSSTFVDEQLRTGIESIFQKIHQHWYHVRVERTGSVIRCSVDGSPLIDYTDAEPIPSGPVALWTQGPNGVMVARLRLAFEKGGDVASPFDRGMGVSPMSLNAGETWRGLGADPSGPAVNLEKEDGERVVRVTNRRSGGNFAVVAETPDVDAIKFPTLSFKYRIAAGSRINAYAKVSGQLWRIALTGPDVETAHSLPIWKVADAKADGQWYTAQVPLLPALREAFPDVATLPIDGIVFGNFEEDEALQEGLSGNAPGASYSIAWLTFAATKTEYAPPTPADPLKVSVKLANPPLLDCDFEKDNGPLESFDGLEGVYLMRERCLRNSDPTAHGLRVSARGMGGSFGVYLYRPAFDVRRCPGLEFDIRIEHGTQINLHFTTHSGRYEIEMTDRTPGYQQVSTFPISDDGKWHHVIVDLEQAVKLTGAGDTPLEYLVHDLSLADSGFAGNTSSACYYIDNVRLHSANPVKDQLKIDWKAPGAVAYEIAFDRNAETKPQEQTKDETRLFPIHEAGSYFLHLCALDGHGRRGPLEHRRIICRMAADGAAPTLSEPQPADGASACVSHVAARISGNSDLSLQDIVFTVNGVEHRAGAGRLSYDSTTGIVRLRLAKNPGETPFKSGEQIHVSLQARDLSGHTSKALAWTWVYDPTAWTHAPAAPYLSVVPGDHAVYENYEDGVGDARTRRGTIVSHDRDAAVGSGALRVENQMQSDFYQATLVAKPFDAVRYPIVSFDLKLNDANGLTLMFIIRNRFKMLTLFGAGYGTSEDWENLGRQDIDTRRELWQHVRIDLRNYIPELKDGGRLNVSAVSTAGQNNGIGASVLLDNLCVSSPKGRDVEFIWQPPADPSGIAGYAIALDQNPATVVDERVTTQETHAAFTVSKPGKWYAHVRAVNGAGKWSATAHVEMIVDP